MNDPFLWITLLIVVMILGLGLFVLFQKKKRFTKEETKKITSLWLEIESLAATHPEQAILKADKLLDYALSKLRYDGSLGEKLKKAAPLFSDINALWKAHKLRNSIAHDVDAKTDPRSFNTAIRTFQHALLDLGLTL